VVAIECSHDSCLKIMAGEFCWLPIRASFGLFVADDVKEKVSPRQQFSAANERIVPTKDYKVAFSAPAGRIKSFAISFARRQRRILSPEAVVQHFSDDYFMDALMIIPGNYNPCDHAQQKEKHPGPGPPKNDHDNKKALQRKDYGQQTIPHRPYIKRLYCPLDYYRDIDTKGGSKRPELFVQYAVHNIPCIVNVDLRGSGEITCSFPVSSFFGIWHRLLSKQIMRQEAFT
jgi:hypothetical protein